MRNAVAMLVLLLIGGCVADNGPGVDTGSSAPRAAKSTQAAGDNAESEKHRELCVDTIEGAESKQICY